MRINYPIMNPFDGLTRQREVFLNKLSGIQSPIPFSYDTLKRVGESKMDNNAIGYISGNAGDGSTTDENRSAFNKWKTVPRVLKNVVDRNMNIELFGQSFKTPVFLSPIGGLELAHPEADLAVAKAAAKLKLPFIFSSQASFTMEACAKEMGDEVRWLQLYWGKEKKLVRSFIERAEAVNCKAIVLTVDTSVLGWRPQDLSNAYLSFLRGLGIAQYINDPVFWEIANTLPDEKSQVKVTTESLESMIKLAKKFPGSSLENLKTKRALKAVKTFTKIFSNPALVWEDLDWLRNLTDLPIILKGIVHPADAQKAKDLGIDGIIVSNHGGRQLAGSISSLDALTWIGKEVKDFPLMIDSGIRNGEDVFKAIALGASAVCIGRPYVYGLAIDGTNGVEEVMRNIIGSFDMAMALTCCQDINEVKNSVLYTV